jgi:hypothetical protein
MVYVNRLTVAKSAGEKDFPSHRHVTVWRVLRTSLYLKAYKPSIFQHLERRIVCMPSSVNVFVTLATQLHLEYHRKALFETSCIILTFNE